MEWLFKNKIFYPKSGREKYLRKYKKIFEQEYLLKEISKSEYTRIRLLCILIWISFFIYLIFYLFLQDTWRASVLDRINIVKVPIAFLIISLYYSVLLSLFKISKWKQGKFSMLLRVLNSCVEGCVPSMLLFFLAPTSDMIHAVTAPQVLVYSIFIIISTLRLNPFLCLLTGAASSISYLAVVYYLLRENPQNAQTSLVFANSVILLKAILLMEAGICAAYVAKKIKDRVFDAFAHLREREVVEQLLGDHVSSVVANELIHNENIDNGEEYDLSVFFLDIRDFTTYADAKMPKDVFAFLNRFFLDIIAIIHSHDGVINKFLGDGFMAVFGAPLVSDKHADQAVVSALEIRGMLAEKNRIGIKFPVSIGIGIHSGLALGGNIGSDLRKEYTIIGDTVNVASRIEQLNKRFHSDILVSKETIEKCSQTFPHKNLGKRTIKGKKKPVEVFKLL